MYNDNQSAGPENKNTGSVTGYYNYSNGSTDQSRPYQSGEQYGSNGNPAYDSNSTTPNKKKKTTRHTFGKVMAIVLCAGLMFGVGAGSALYMSGYFNQTESKTALAQNESNNDSLTQSATDELNQETNNDHQTTLSATSTALSAAYSSMDIANIVKEAMPSIVSVTSTITAKYPTMFGQILEQSGTDAGSGIIIGENDNELLVATNYHVIENADSGSIQIGFCDETTAPAGLKGTDKDMDLAIVAVSKSDVSADTMNTIKISTIGDSEALQLGEPVIAIGNGLGYGQSVSYGIVSALNREIQSESGDTNTYIQTDAAINPGNSGGALLNGKGELIGITSAKIADSSVEGMGFAIPVSSAKPILDNLMTEETKVAVEKELRGDLGVRVATPTGVDGAYVVEVTEDGAAAKAGLKVGDIITGADDNQIASAEDLTELLQYYEAGREIQLNILRKQDKGYVQETISVVLEKLSNS